jgi:hypothetical protein
MKVPSEYKSVMLSELNNLDLDNVWKLRGNLNVLKKYVLQNPGKDNELVTKDIEELLEISGSFYQFLSNIKGSVTATDFNKLARLLNTSGDVVEAIEEILTAEDVKFWEILASGLALVLDYAGSTAYISSALENAETVVKADSLIVYDRLWGLIHKYNQSATPVQLKEINLTMNTFFKHLSDKNINLTERITLVTRLYQLLCMIYMARIIKEITWVAEASDA